MVSLRKRHNNRSPKLRAYLFCAMIIVFLALPFAPRNDYVIVDPTLNLDAAGIEEYAALDVEAMEMKKWRLELESRCRHFLRTRNHNITADDLEMKSKMEIDALQKISIPKSTAARGEKPLSYPVCDHVFLDLGTNRGDTIGCAVDASLDVCSALFVDKDPNLRRDYRLSLEFPRLHFDLDDLHVHRNGSKAFSLQPFLQKFFLRQGMESVCVYGVEGNPYFTSSLQRMESVINNMKPRPLKYLGIHTDTIVSSKDGPSVLYLDQFSVENHFWGSSVFENMPDVQKTARQNNGTSVLANVTGMSLSTLLRKTLKPFQSKETATKQGGGTLLVKMDIEGAEFETLKELASSGLICDYTQLGNRVTFMVEFHQRLIKDPVEKRAAMDGLQETRSTLGDCGVEWKRLPNYFT